MTDADSRRVGTDAMADVNGKDVVGGSVEGTSRTPDLGRGFAKARVRNATGAGGRASAGEPERRERLGTGVANVMIRRPKKPLRAGQGNSEPKVWSGHGHGAVGRK